MAEEVIDVVVHGWVDFTLLARLHNSFRTRDCLRRSEQNSCCLHALSLSLLHILSLSPFLGKWREWGKVWLSARARIVARLNAIWDRAFGWVPVEGVLVAAVAAAVVVVAVAILLSFSHQWTELYTHTVSVIIYSNVVFERVRMSTTTKRDRCFQLSWSSLVC